MAIILFQTLEDDGSLGRPNIEKEPMGEPKKNPVKNERHSECNVLEFELPFSSFRAH